MAKDAKETVNELRPPQSNCPEGKSWQQVCEEADENEEPICKWVCL